MEDLVNANNFPLFSYYTVTNQLNENAYLEINRLYLLELVDMQRPPATFSSEVPICSRFSFVVGFCVTFPLLLRKI